MDHILCGMKNEVARRTDWEHTLLQRIPNKRKYKLFLYVFISDECKCACVLCWSERQSLVVFIEHYCFWNISNVWQLMIMPNNLAFWLSSLPIHISTSRNSTNWALNRSKYFFFVDFVELSMNSKWYFKATDCSVKEESKINYITLKWNATCSTVPFIKLFIKFICVSMSSIFNWFHLWITGMDKWMNGVRKLCDWQHSLWHICAVWKASWWKYLLEDSHFYILVEFWCTNLSCWSEQKKNIFPSSVWMCVCLC